MMNREDFRTYGHELVDWMADYLENVASYPVKSQVKPGEIAAQLPSSAPQAPESMTEILEDFNKIIMPGITHWQSPNFFAYFNANNSYPSILAEMLTATLGAQCMIWDTSPAAAELEERVLDWLKSAMGLPTEFEGVIQDTASSATLCAILSARERATNFQVNRSGMNDNRFRVYASTQTHSSIDKAVKIAGLGQENLVKVGVDEHFAMRPEALAKKIQEDKEKGFKPLCVVATLGTTGTTAVDPLAELSAICRDHGVWLHVDAAFGGTALLLPEYHWMIKGIETVDSFVFNPHKWMFTNFDCSVYYVRDAQHLIRTFEILPEYLKTSTRGQVNDYRDWGIALGRRFRALKLWFVIRSYGITGLQQRIRNHLDYAAWLESQIETHSDFEVMASRAFNLVCFRFHPQGEDHPETLNELNASLLSHLNETGRVYLTHTKLHGAYVLRMAIGQTYLEKTHVEQAWEAIQKTAKNLDQHPEEKATGDRP